MTTGWVVFFLIGPPMDDFIEDGFVVLARRSLESQVFQNDALWKMFCWCLMKANHKDNWVSVTVGKATTEVLVRRGQFIFGRESAAKELRMKPSSVRNRIEKLKNMRNVDTKVDSNYTIVSICNYEHYQTIDNYKGQQRGQPEDSRRTAGGQPEDTNNNVKKEKNVKNEKNKNPLPPKGGSDGFEKFWEAYPKKRAKIAAQKAWAKIKPNPELLATMLKVIDRDKKSPEWLKDNGNFIPHPATWLNGGCWDDEAGISNSFNLLSIDPSRSQSLTAHRKAEAELGTNKILSLEANNDAEKITENV